jgi:DNA-binding NtrC family response regulator
MPITKARLLIVDDEFSVRTTLSAVLAAIGYQVRTAEDGISALNALCEEMPEILISDLNMPGMSGFELLTAVRCRFPDLKTIAMSGAFSGDEVPSGVAADAFYEKGSSVACMLKLIENLPWPERRAVDQPAKRTLTECPKRTLMEFRAHDEREAPRLMQRRRACSSPGL